jgi:hypothetical protein
MPSYGKKIIYSMTVNPEFAVPLHILELCSLPDNLSLLLSSKKLA